MILSHLLILIWLYDCKNSQFSGVNNFSEFYMNIDGVFLIKNILK